MNLGHVQIFLQKATPSPDACPADFLVDDSDALFDFHRGQGVEIAMPIADREYGIRDYVVRDPWRISRSTSG